MMLRTQARELRARKHEAHWREQIPTGYYVRIWNGLFQPMRDWGGDVNTRYEALYADERLIPLTYQTLVGAVKCCQRFAANAFASRELVWSRAKVVRFWQCERCGEAVLDSSDLIELSADGVDWLACQKCCDALDRTRERHS